MLPARPDLRRGRIIWAQIKDPNGRSKKRPANILTPTDEITEAEPLIVLAITTTYIDPAPIDHVELPWTNRGHPITRLKRRSAAVLRWVDEIPLGTIEEVGGDVPAKQMNLIQEKLDALPE
jgi:mRNA-degrading endonuclease toxin of MazEF toxin-antitoxin module